MADTTTTVDPGQGSLISELAGQLLLPTAPADEQGYSDAKSYPQDNRWVKQSFLVTTDANGNIKLSDQQKYNRDHTSADLKFTDSSIGGNIPINPPTQFTRYCDIRRPGIHLQGGMFAAADVAHAPPAYVDVAMGKDVNYGMGDYYSEAIDDNSQIIHLRFGVASYNSLTQFFTGFYDSGMATVARTGRISQGFAGRFLTFTGNLIGLAIAPLFLIPIAITMIATAARFMANIPPTKFYYSKPAMPVYWTAVTNMVNQIASNMGLISYLDTRQSNAVTKGFAATNVRVDGDGRTSYGGILGAYLPAGLVRPDGLLDVKVIACRAKILQEKYHAIISKVMDDAGNDALNGPGTSFSDSLKLALGNLRTDINSAAAALPLEAYLTSHINTKSYGGAPDSPSTTGAISPSGARTGSTVDEPSANTGGTEVDLRTQSQSDPNVYDPDKAASYLTELETYFVANLADGSDWASFRVDYTGSQQESFQNGTEESSLASKINSMSSSNRDIRMNLADGNIIPGMETIMGAVKNVMGGVAEVLHIDGIAALAGSAFVDIPKHWSNSTSSLPHASYTMTLISPYGNPVSQLLHLYLPLSMILAGALPLSTGAQSHTSPFLCELHDKGRIMTRLGIIDSVTVERGVGNVGFDNQGRCLAINVTFSILDLSSIVAMPAMPSFDILNPLRGIFDSDNAFSDYLMTLASMPLSEVIYRIPMLKYQVNKRIADFKSALSPANVAQNLASLPGVNLLSALMRGVEMP